MKKKVIWYCTGCKEKCAAKITDGYTPYRNSEDACLLFITEHCEVRGFEPNWRKYEPEAK